MWGGRRRPVSPVRRLTEAAGLKWTSEAGAADFGAGLTVAYRASSRSADVTASVAAVAEELAADEANHELVVGLLENLQNLASHGREEFRSPEEIVALLGPRCTEYWNVVAVFWEAVAEWRAASPAPMKSAEEILAVQNEQLRLLLWTGNRSLPAGTCVGVADAVRYEKSGGDAIPGYDHVMAAVYRLGPN